MHARVIILATLMGCTATGAQVTQTLFCPDGIVINALPGTVCPDHKTIGKTMFTEPSSGDNDTIIMTPTVAPPLRVCGPARVMIAAQAVDLPKGVCVEMEIKIGEERK